MATSLSNQLLTHLIHSSTPYRDPLASIPWEELDRDRLWLPEPALSLYGTPEYAGLSRGQRRSLSQYEYIHLLLAGLWSEGLIMKRLAACLRSRDSGHLTYYLHQLREKAGHSLMSLEFLRHCPLGIPENPFFEQHLLVFLGKRAGFDSPAFWIGMLLQEELRDRIHRLVRLHRDELCPVAVKLSSVQVIDQARHITHARDTVAGLLAKTPSWRLRMQFPLLGWGMGEYLRTLYFPPASTYILAGLSPGRRWAYLARKNHPRWELVYRHLGPSLRFLDEHGVKLNLHLPYGVVSEDE